MDDEAIAIKELSNSKVANHCMLGYSLASYAMKVGFLDSASFCYSLFRNLIYREKGQNPNEKMNYQRLLF